MKRLVLIGLLGVLIGTANSQIFGVGGTVGKPPFTLSAKYWLSKPRAWDFGVWWGQKADKFNLHTHFTYLSHIYGIIPDPHWSFYGGIGGRFEIRGTAVQGASQKIAIGPRVAGGGDFFYSPIEIFFEACPTLDLLPSLALDVDFGIGLRYFFGRR